MCVLCVCARACVRVCVSECNKSSGACVHMHSSRFHWLADLLHKSTSLPQSPLDNNNPLELPPPIPLLGLKNAPKLNIATSQTFTQVCTYVCMYVSQLQWNLSIEDTTGTQLAVLYTVEPLYRGHHWDPAGCPVYSGTSL